MSAGLLVSGVGTSAVAATWGSAWLVRARLLFQVAPSDPKSLGAAVLLLLVGIAATLVPARRAAAVDPMRVLREE